MSLKIFNTLSAKEEEFKPINPKLVTMYTCGPTVYNRAHIGNLRSYIFSDIIRRTLEYQGYKVKQVINITDVGHLTDDADSGEDKIEKSARENKKSASEIASMYTNLFLDDLALMNIEMEDTIFPKATDNIPEQIEMIEELEKRGFTYKTSDGIYYDTSKFPEYGELGQIDIEGLKEGARVNKNSEKKNPTDFALWKFSPKGSQRQQEWDSPWGVGFPGWHIECSAMSRKFLGDTFDIHTGGVDHIAIHHNNEIAQSKATTNKPQAHYYLHHNHITLDGERIAKSLGNVIYLSELEKKGYSPLAYRYLLMTIDYRKSLNFNFDSLKAAQSALDKIIFHLVQFTEENKDGGNVSASYKNQFIDALNDNLNTSKAISIMWELLKDSDISDVDKKATILDFDRVLGLNLKKAVIETIESENNIPAEIKNLLEQRDKARESKDFEKSDKIRDMIEESGYILIDTPKGSKVKKVFR